MSEEYNNEYEEKEDKDKPTITPPPKMPPPPVPPPSVPPPSMPPPSVLPSFKNVVASGFNDPDHQPCGIMSSMVQNSISQSLGKQSPEPATKPAPILEMVNYSK